MEKPVLYHTLIRSSSISQMLPGLVTVKVSLLVETPLVGLAWNLKSTVTTPCIIVTPN